MKQQRQNHHHSFAEVPHANIERSSFDRSHGHKTTFNVGQLIPVYIDEALPGDTFNLSMTAFSRLSTPIFPLMDNIYMDVHYFAVPNRILWDNWERFNGAQDNPGDTTDYTVPTLTRQFQPGDLADHFGVPTGTFNLSINSLFHRAYRTIWDTWYRDENLQDSYVLERGDGPDNDLDFIFARGKKKDYFSSCLPWPQKGDASVVPLGDRASVKLDSSSTKAVKIYYSNHTALANSHALKAHGPGTSPNALGFENETTVGIIDPNDTLYADLSTATAVSINQLREAFQMQHMLERDARGGTRYIEIIKSHFGVTSPDSRLQRPEYLGGGSTMLNISPIAQTSATDSTSPQANLSATGTSTLVKGFTKSFVEHCVVMGLVSTYTDVSYQQGLNRMFSRRTRYDFYWPSLSHLGEQVVHNREIYAQGNSADDAAFGYQERYAEYRYKPSTISGKFRSTTTGSLDSWHLAEHFSSLPLLNSTFLNVTTSSPVSRVVAVPSEPHFIFDSHFEVVCARPMPTYSIPGLVDHF